MLTLSRKFDSATRDVKISVDEGDFTATIVRLPRAEVDDFDAARRAATTEVIKIGYALLGEMYGEDERARLISIAVDEICRNQKAEWDALLESERAGKFFAVEYPDGLRRQEALRFVASSAAAKAGKANARREVIEKFLLAAVQGIAGLSDDGESGKASPVTSITPAVAGGMMNTVVHINGEPVILGDLLANSALNAQYLSAHEKKA